MAVKALSRPASAVDKRRKWTTAQVAAEILKYVTLIALAITFLVPFYWMTSSAMKDQAQIFTIPPKWVPSPAYFGNFFAAWNTMDFNHYAFNTVFKYAIPATIGTVFSSAIVAYGFSRLTWPGRNILFSICLATMMIPSQVTLVPLFIIFKNLDWINTYLPLVVPAFFGNAFFIFMLRQFFRTIPAELSEAAKIDGASEFAILFRIILPLTKPALMVVALFAMQGAWNDYLGPLIYVNDERQWTLALGVQRMGNALSEVGFKDNAYAYLMGVSTIMTLPLLIAFFFAQRSFIEGITMSGVKG